MGKPKAPSTPLATHEAEDWTVTQTVHADRRNIFAWRAEKPRHVGTLVSGSRTRLRQFAADAALIGEAAQLKRRLLSALQSMRLAVADQHRLEIDAAWAEWAERAAPQNVVAFPGKPGPEAA